MRRVGTFACPRVDLSGRVAVVTGGSGGIGLQACRALAGMGARVILGARSQETREATCDAIVSDYPAAQVEHVALDLSDLTSVRSFAEEVLSLLGEHRIDIFLQNAGLWPQTFARSVQGHEIAFATTARGLGRLFQDILERRGFTVSSV